MPLAGISRLAPPRKAFDPHQRLRVAGWYVLLAACLCAGVALMIPARPQQAPAARQASSFDYLLSGASGLGLPQGHLSVASLMPLDDRASITTRAIRIGAANAELEIAADARNLAAPAAYYARDTAAIASVAANSDIVVMLVHHIVHELDRIPGGDDVVPLYTAVARAGAARATIGTELARARAQALRLEPPYVAAGNWLAFARIAAARGDRTYFEHPDSRRMMEDALKLTGISPPARSSLQRIVDIMSRDGSTRNSEILAATSDALVLLMR